MEYTVLGVGLQTILKTGRLLAGVTLAAGSVLLLRSYVVPAQLAEYLTPGSLTTDLLVAGMFFSMLCFMVALIGLPRKGWLRALTGQAPVWLKGVTILLFVHLVVRLVPLSTQSERPEVMNGELFLIQSCCGTRQEPIVRENGRQTLLPCASIVRQLSEEEYLQRKVENRRGFFAMQMALCGLFLTAFCSRLREEELGGRDLSPTQHDWW